MKHLFCTLYWTCAYRFYHLHLRLHRCLWWPAQIGSNLMGWWRRRDFEYTNPGITAHGIFPWETHTGQRRHEGMYSASSDPFFVVWRIGFLLNRLGCHMSHRLTRLTTCDCFQCTQDD